MHDRVLVRFARGTAGPARASARAAVGTELDVAYRIVPGLERLKLRPGRTVEETVAALSRNPNVIYVEPDFAVHATVQPNDPSYNSLWGMANINAPEAWDITTGSGDVVVAIIDTGIDGNHVDLSENLWTNPGEVADNGLDDDDNGYVDDVHGWDFAYDDNDPSDGHGHGTHVAGTVGALGNNGIGVVGVNWRVKLVALKFLDDTGNGYTSDAVSALQYAQDKHIRITNNSWGGGYSQSLYDAIASVQADGHLFVAAAGNNNANTDTTPFYPSSYNLENVISVASITSSDTRSSFSNYGLASVDIGAPGSSIYSTVPGGYGTFSGTSMAAPHVTGAAALLLSRYPTWSYGQLRTAILNTARPIAALSGRTVTGGTLDLYGAITAPQEFPSFELAPTALGFGEQAVGGTSAAQGVTLTNTGTLVLPISSISTNSQFIASHACGTSVAVGASCTISVAFRPSSGGTKTASLSVTGGNGAGTKTVALSGTGIVPLFALAPTALGFGEQAVGGTSGAQVVTLTNTGTLVLPLSVSSTNTQFIVSHACGTSVAVGASCAISVVFRPSSGGTKTASLSVAGGNGAGTKTVALSGSGIVPLYALAPTALGFGEQAVGGTSATQVVTLTNTGTLVLPLSVRSTNTQFIVSHTCGTSVAVGASCAISVAFRPSSGGTKTASLSVTGGNGAGTKTVALSGTGIL